MNRSTRNVLGVGLIGANALAFFVIALSRSIAMSTGGWQLIVLGLGAIGVPLILAAVGWKDALDVEPRNVPAAALFITLPLLLPLAGTAIATLAGARITSHYALLWFPVGFIGTLLGSVMRAHYMPTSVCRTCMIVSASVISLCLGGLIVLVCLGIG